MRTGSQKKPRGANTTWVVKYSVAKRIFAGRKPWRVPREPRINSRSPRCRGGRGFWHQASEQEEVVWCFSPKRSLSFEKCALWHSDHRKYVFGSSARLRNGFWKRHPRVKNRTTVTCFFFVTTSQNRRARLAYWYRAPLPGRRTVFAPLPGSRSPPPGPGGFRPESSHRPGGNDRVGRVIAFLVCFSFVII